MARKNSTLTKLAMGVVAAATLAAATIAAGPKDGKDGYKAMDSHAVAKVGEKAPDFTLTDTDGNTHTLSEVLAKEGVNAVVLEWYNPQCPFVVKHHKHNTTMADTYAAFQAKGVKWAAINSGAEGKQGAGLELNKEMKTEYKIAYPVLLDTDGKVGKMYSAKTTPHMFVINADGILVYAGAIDNNRSPRNAGDVNYVEAALNSVLAGETVEQAQTRPYGCSVKYAAR
ncbi:MAG: thioredoxin family protein [Planctomycetota bacterium]